MSQSQSSLQRPISSYRGDTQGLFSIVLALPYSLNWMVFPQSQASILLGVCGSTVSPVIFLPATVLLVLISLGSKDR